MRKAIFSAAIALLAATTAIHADVWNKKTKVTFSAPFQIPATSGSKVMTLGPGTYIFRLVESNAARHVVQVTDESGTKVYSTILAIPDYRLNPTSKTVMYFTERASGAPQAVKSWFYPGDNMGQRFVYPKVQAVQVAAVVHQPVPSHQMETVVVEKVRVVEVPVYIETPAKQETPYHPEQLAKLDAQDTAGEEGEPVAALPKTASQIYLLGLLGLMFVAASLVVRRTASALG
jgi:hypothetical protein